jgi:hypothetical protein
MRVSSLLIILGLLLNEGFYLGSSPAYGEGQPETPMEWPAELGYRLRSEVRSLRVELSKALFNGIREVDLYTLRFVKEEFKSRLGRQVINNRDPLNTYTVIDRLEFQATQMPLQYDLPGLTAFGASAGVRSQGRISAAHVRVVPASQSRDLPERLSLLSAEEQPPLREIELDPLPNDPALRPRFYQPWRLLKLPYEFVRFQTTLERMTAGEILTYGTEGVVSMYVGVSLGNLKLIGGQALGLGPEFSGSALNVSADLYVAGAYRISVLKESDTVLRVKLQREGGWGYGMGFEMGRARTGLQDGLLLLKTDAIELKTGAPRTDLKLFGFRTGENSGRFHDQDFRLDLTEERARAALSDALLGRFALAGRYSEVESSGVTRVAEREGKRYGHEIQSQIRFQIWDWNRVHRKGTLEGELRIGEFSTPVIQSSLGRESRWQTFWGWSERKDVRFQVTSDPQLGHFLVAERTIEETRSGWRRFEKYLEWVRAITERGDLVPPSLPQSLVRRTRGPTGRVYLNLGYFLTREHLRRIAGLSESEWQQAVVRAIDRELGREVHRPRALRKLTEKWREFRQWTQLEESPVSEIHQRLREIFDLPNFMPEVFGSLREALRGQSVESYVTLETEILDRVFVRGALPDSLMDIQQALLPDMGFGDDPSLGQALNHEARVLSARAEGDQLCLELEVSPIWVYLRLQEEDLPSPSAPLERLIQVASPEARCFVVGDNSDRTGAWGQVLSRVQVGRRYQLQVALKDRGSSWGPVRVMRLERHNQPPELVVELLN